MTEYLRIRLLGPFIVERDGTPLPDSAWHTRQACQLLKILITYRHRTVPTDQLIEWLWPDSPLAASSVTLRTTASALRHALEPERLPRSPSRYVLTRPPGYALDGDPSIWIDVVAFEALLKAAASAADSLSQRHALEEALALYRDDYLVDDPYAEWALAERERLSELHLTALADLAELFATSGEYERASSYCRRILSRDPCREPAYRSLMHYQSLAGDVAGAMRIYERCRQKLADELGAEPAPQTKSLFDRLSRGDLPSILTDVVKKDRDPLTAVRSPLPPFFAPYPEILVGRELEVSFLRQFLDQTLAGAGATVAVEGESGVGKTRLVIDLLEHAVERGAVVLSGHCVAVGESLPYASLVEALRKLFASLPTTSLQLLPQSDLAHVAQLLPALRDRLPDLPSAVTTSVSEDRQRLAGSIVAVLLALAEQRRGLVLFLDDVQWIDEATVTALARLAPLATGAPLLVLLAYSVEEVGEHGELLGMLRHLTRHHYLHRLTLARLSPVDVSVFVEKIVGRLDRRLEALAERLYRISEGNALFLVETVRALLDRPGQAAPEELLAAATVGEPAGQIRDVILARLARLPAEARSMLDFAAVIGRDFPLDLLEQAGGGDPLPSLETLIRRRFLREEPGGRIDFWHPLVRRVVQDDLSALARRRLHRRVADALALLAAGDAASPAEISYHYQRAGESSAREALRYAVQAGDDALLVFGFRQAVLHFDAALAVSDRLRPESEVIALIERAYHGLGSAYEALAERDNVVGTYQRMREWGQRRSDRRVVIDASRRLVAALAVFGYLQESSTLSADLVAQLPPNSPAAVTDLLRRIMLLLRRPCDQALEGPWPRFQPAPAPVGAPWEDFVQLFGPQHAVQPLNHYGWALLTQGQLAAAEACFSRASELAADTRQVAAQLTSCQLLAQSNELQGNWDAVQRWLEECYRLVQRMPQSGWPSIWTSLFVAFLQLRIGLVGNASRTFAAIHEHLSVSGDFPTHRLTARVGLGWAALRQGDPAAAQVDFTAALVEPAALFAPIYVWACLGQARAAYLLGEGGVALLASRRALLFSGERCMPREYIGAAIAIAFLAHAGGQPAEAADLLDEAASLAREIGLRPALLDIQRAELSLGFASVEAVRPEGLCSTAVEIRALVAEQRAAIERALTIAEGCLAGIPTQPHSDS